MLSRIVALLTLLPNVLLAQHTIKGVFTPAKDYKVVLLYKVTPTVSEYITNAEIQKDGSFNIVSMGHRNPQGLAWNSEGELYSSEHGQSANDEINKIVQGGNYGWPEIEGNESKEGMYAPLLTSGANETWAPSGMTFHDGLLSVAALRGKAILVIDPDRMEIVDKIDGYGRIRDIYSDGESLFFITNNTDGRGNPTESDDIFYKIGSHEMTVILE